MTVIKRILFAVFLTVAGLPLSAQQKSDSADYRFSFVADKDMFFTPWSGNGKELERLLSAINEHRSAIEAGQMYLLVTSYGTDGNAEQTATEVAKIRRSRVKSELIVRGKVKEAHFVTDQSFDAAYTDGSGKSLRNIVIVTLPASVVKVAEIAGAEAAARVEAYNKEISGEAERERLAAEEKAKAEREAKERTERERLAAEQAAREKAEAERTERERVAAEQAEKERLVREEQARLQAEQAAKATPYHFAVRANLLRWATLTPDLGLEWRINRHVGILVNGSWTSWTWNDSDRRYALWEVNPEVRYYIGKEKRGYIGAMYKAGTFNYKLSATGKQGDLTGGGLVGGYQLKLNRALALDFTLGVGCVRADYDKYTVIDGVRVKRGKESKNWWGPTQAGVTLVWTIF
ncbi:MAG: DUF3575 domain-containing protein [Alistipes sp.]|nr:DUF3575 domain-containing protein [Alistipes sp.]